MLLVLVYSASFCDCLVTMVDSRGCLIPLSHYEKAKSSHLLEERADIGDGENDPSFQEKSDTSDNEGCEVVPTGSFQSARAPCKGIRPPDKELVDVREVRDYLLRGRTLTERVEGGHF